MALDSETNGTPRFSSCYKLFAKPAQRFRSPVLKPLFHPMKDSESNPQAAMAQAIQNSKPQIQAKRAQITTVRGYVPSQRLVPKELLAARVDKTV